MTTDVLSGKTVVFGVTGGIAAYKAAEVCSALVKGGASVHVIMTEHAMRFIGPVTFRTLTGNPVITGLFDEPREHEIAHVALADRADVMLIAPATANIIGKIASGIADDMLSTAVMAADCPVVLAPAMNYRMWENPMVRANVERLETLGYRFVNPEQGRLACGEEGVGRLASPEAIVQSVVDCLERLHDLEGVSVLVTAGPTQEPIDAVRYIANYSSGKMGYAIARAGAERGAAVCLISGPTSLPTPPGVELVRVQTAAQMLDAVLARIARAQVVIGAAAVADYTPKASADKKLKRTSKALSLELVPTKDIMAEVGRQKNRRVIVGFAAETESLVENARKKLASKNLDFIVANDVSQPGIGFGADVNEVTIIGKSGEVIELPRLSKLEIGHRLFDVLKEVLATSGAIE